MKQFLLVITDEQFEALKHEIEKDRVTGHESDSILVEQSIPFDCLVIPPVTFPDPSKHEMAWDCKCETNYVRTGPLPCPKCKAEPDWYEKQTSTAAEYIKVRNEAAGVVLK